MLGTHDLPAFLLASLLLWLTPGPDTMYILARSVSQGRRAGLLSGCGIGAGLLVHTAFAALGLSALLATSALAFNVVKFAGAFYLVYLGIEALRKRPATLKPNGVPTAPAQRVGWQVFRQGVLTNVLNPKVAIFFLAFLPQFVDPEAGRGPLSFLFLGMLFVVGGTLWGLVLSLSASRATQAFRNNAAAMEWVQRASGCLYIALGLNLLRSKPQPG
jgi:RhtB (resistance to homoserine/threonine) family protein